MLAEKSNARNRHEHKEIECHQTVVSDRRRRDHFTRNVERIGERREIHATADVRYWSICLGSAETYSYASIYDKEMPKVDKEGFVTFIIADANSAKLPDLQAKAEANDGTYILTWNRKEQGDGILALYRNMVINENYPHSMRKLMESVPLAAAGGDMSGFNPMKMIAMLAMGNWGPQGYKFSEDDFLSDSFNYANIRRMK